MDIMTIMPVPLTWYTGGIILFITLILTIYCIDKDIDHPLVSMGLIFITIISFVLIWQADSFFTAIAAVDYPKLSLTHAVLLTVAVGLSIVNGVRIYSSLKTS